MSERLTLSCQTSPEDIKNFIEEKNKKIFYNPLYFYISGDKLRYECSEPNEIYLEYKTMYTLIYTKDYTSYPLIISSSDNATYTLEELVDEIFLMVLEIKRKVI